MLHELSLTIDDSEEADDTPVYKKDKRFKLKIGIVVLLALVLATIVTVVVGIIIGHIHT